MNAQTKMIVVNCAMLIGLALERWRGAPWLAIAITAAIALPLANTLMYFKAQRSAANVSTRTH